MKWTWERWARQSSRWIWLVFLILPWLALLVCLSIRLIALACVMGCIALACSSVSVFFLSLSSRPGYPVAVSTVPPPPPLMDEINSPSLQGEVRLQDVPSLPHSLAKLRTMDYKDFELLSAAVLVACEEQQFVMHTGKRGDRGVDVLLRNAVGNRVILQCKRNAASNPVGPSKIRELGGTLKTHRAAYGYLLTSSTFTRAAYQEKESHGFIRTFDGSELMGLLQRHPHAIAQALAAIYEQIEEAAQR